MTKREVVKIIFLALIAGTIMGIVLIEIFGTLTLMKLFQLEICIMIFIIIFFLIYFKQDVEQKIEKHE